MDSAIKHKIIGEFETMRLIEQDAHELYLKASMDPGVTDPKVRTCFQRIATDEQRHVDLVERIMNIVRNCL
jgi:rubrerythrin